MLKNNLLILLALLISLPGCSILEYTSFNDEYTEEEEESCEDDKFSKGAAVGYLFLGALSLIAQDRSDDSPATEVKQNYIFSENSIVIDKISLKPMRRDFYSPYYNLRAEPILIGKVNVFLTYDSYDEEYYLIQIKESKKIFQIPVADNKFKKLILSMIKDNVIMYEGIDHNTIIYENLLDIIDEYNSYYTADYN